MKKTARREHDRRETAFLLGALSLAVPVLVFTVLGRLLEIDVWSVDVDLPSWLSFVLGAAFALCWRGLRYFAVGRHDPHRSDL